jgi:hypothetical protein
MLPLFRWASCRAAHTFAPEEIPTSNPWSRPSARGRPDRVLVGHLDYLVHQLDIEHGGDESVPDALNLVQAGFVAKQGGHIPGFNRHDADARFVFAEEAADALQGAAAAQAGHESRHVAVHLAPQLMGLRNSALAKIGSPLRRISGVRPIKSRMLSVSMNAERNLRVWGVGSKLEPGGERCERAGQPQRDQRTQRRKAATGTA